MVESSIREKESMEEGLLAKDHKKERYGFFGFGELVKEVRQLSYLAGPMVAVNLSHYFLQVIALMMVGHLGKLYLSSSAIAVSFGAVSGFSLLFGMSSALETLTGQAYGAKQYRKLGIQTNTAIFSLILVSLPLSLVWIYMGKILVFMGQDPQISKEACQFLLWLIPALFAYATLQPLVRYFQSQSLIHPLLVSSCVSICCHVPLCWTLVFKCGLGNRGGALAIGLSYWLNVILLFLYMNLSPACESTRVPIFSKFFEGFGEFFRFAIPSAAMICLQWWASEVVTLLSGFLPNPQLETSLLSVCFSTMAALYTIPEGLGQAGSTRVSNELGAGNPKAARFAVSAVMFLTVSQAVIVSSILFAGRSAFGYIFSNEKEVVDYATNMAPMLCLSVILNSIHVVLSGFFFVHLVGAFSQHKFSCLINGVSCSSLFSPKLGIARGCGWQDLGAYVNLGSYYLFGIPIAAVLSFWLDLRGKGLWIGIIAGASLQTFLLAVITFCTNWEKKARMARERLFEEVSGR